MAAFKDQNKKKNAWYASFYYTDWTGKRKKKFKRGFATKREALEFEQEFLKISTTSMDMTLEQFSEVYFNNKAQELKERTLRNKRYMIKAHIIPYFGRKRMNEITPADLIAWQNEMMKKGYSDCYLRMIQNQLTALLLMPSVSIIWRTIHVNGSGVWENLMQKDWISGRKRSTGNLFQPSHRKTSTM